MYKVEANIKMPSLRVVELLRWLDELLGTSTITKYTYRFALL